MNENEVSPLGNESETELSDTNTETETPEFDEYGNPLEYLNDEELPPLEEELPPLEEAAPVSRPAYAPINRPDSPALERLQANLDEETFRDILAVIDERTQYGLQSFAVTSGRFNQVAQQEQEFASVYGETMGAVIAAMPPEMQSHPDAINQAAAMALYQKAQINGRSVIEEIRHFNNSRASAAAPSAPARSAPAPRNPNGGQGARPSANSARGNSPVDRLMRLQPGLSRVEAETVNQAMAANRTDRKEYR